MPSVTAPRQPRPIPFPSKGVTVSTAATDRDQTELVARCQAGDAEAFETLYRHHASRIYTLASRMAGSPEDGEDLLQEIFLQAYRKIASFKGDAAIGTWLYRLALNHCLDYVRGRQAKMKRQTDTLDADRSFEPAARRDMPIARLDLERAIARLPEGCREAFVLHDVEGYRHDEIADLMGLAIGTTKAQLHRARKLLKERLQR